MEIGTGPVGFFETPVDRGRNTSITCHGYVFRHISLLSSISLFLSFFSSSLPPLFLSFSLHSVTHLPSASSRLSIHPLGSLRLQRFRLPFFFLRLRSSYSSSLATSLSLRSPLLHSTKTTIDYKDIIQLLSNSSSSPVIKIYINLISIPISRVNKLDSK